MPTKSRYSAEEVAQVRAQAVFFPSDARCPRHGDPMAVTTTFAFRHEPGGVTEGRFEHWPPPEGWEASRVEIACPECGVVVPAQTSDELREGFRRVVELVGEGMKARNRDPVVVHPDDRYLTVKVEARHDRAEKWPFPLVPDNDLRQRPDKVAARILAAYDAQAGSRE